MSDASPKSAEGSVEEPNSGGGLTIQQIYGIIDKLDQQGAVNLDTRLRDLLGPVNNVLAREADEPVEGLEAFVVDHYYLIGRNPPAK